jgi:hypothetical protein
MQQVPPTHLQVSLAQQPLAANAKVPDACAKNATIINTKMIIRIRVSFFKFS